MRRHGSSQPKRLYSQKRFDDCVSVLTSVFRRRLMGYPENDLNVDSSSHTASPDR